MAGFPWVIVSREDYDAWKIERMTLCDALREANNEIRRQRMLIAGFRGEDKAIARTVSAVLRK